MNHEEYVNKVKELESRLLELNREYDVITQRYIESEQIYKKDDYLLVSFPRYDGEIIKMTCKIMNVYPFGTNTGKSFAKGKLEYFARLAWRNESGEITIGDICRLGPLSNSSIVCGYLGIDWETVNIEVIDESELLGVHWKEYKKE